MTYGGTHLTLGQGFTNQVTSWTIPKATITKIKLSLATHQRGLIFNTVYYSCTIEDELNIDGGKHVLACF